ncbi:hypothetical protein NHX12_020472 [Muraenolepis orangiensis]|uniref:Piwi domain-containing protein n=1 Tax=Muraenolepis orangiensis TaxID=630683 RepID=A0A9Q0EUX7_9TELE|nr:hypothetical protein NHX12_020472 [Muraenolepis orangiensis]
MSGRWMCWTKSSKEAQLLSSVRAEGGWAAKDCTRQGTGSRTTPSIEGPGRAHHHGQGRNRLEVTDNNQVLLVSHVKKMGPAMLIPEFCYLTGLTDKMRSDFTIMEDPEQRELRLNTLVNNIQKNEQAQMELSTWGLNSDKQLLSVTGRVLPAERLIQGSRRYYPNRADWSREMRGLPLISAPPLGNWLLFYTRRNAGDVQHLLESLHKVSGPLGIRMQKAVMVEYVDTQESLLRALQHNAGPQTQMVVVVLSSDRQDKYDRVKKYLCVDCPTPSRCVRGYTLSRVQQLMTVATKIALQMVCKMGGELWSVEIPLKQLMISQPGHVTLVLKVCASRQRTRDYGLKMALVGALKDYLKFNNSLPSRIMVYRDGVGDGMLQSVVNYEVPQIMESIKSLGEDYMPKLTVVVVKKRVSSRFFAHMDRKVANPPPGTVIDTDANPPGVDFYIVSQEVRIGSVSPTHYNVVYDTSGLKPDRMQRLTYKLCHVYYNWQGTIRVPVPCLYAHKLAFLVGQSIHRQPSNKLDDYLFYL